MHIFKIPSGTLHLYIYIGDIYICSVIPPHIFKFHRVASMFRHSMLWIVINSRVRNLQRKVSCNQWNKWNGWPYHNFCMMKVFSFSFFFLRCVRDPTCGNYYSPGQRILQFKFRGPIYSRACLRCRVLGCNRSNHPFQRYWVYKTRGKRSTSDPVIIIISHQQQPQQWFV